MKNISYRTFRVMPDTAKDKTKPISAVIASENPVRDFDFSKFMNGEDPFVNRILIMQGCKVPDENRMPLIDSHDRSTIKNSLGSIEMMRCQGGELQGDLSFDSTDDSQRAAVKVREGHIRDLSAGFEVNHAVVIPAGKKAMVMGREFEGPVEVADDWTPHEGSLTILGADSFAKVMRTGNVDEIKSLLEKFSENLLTRKDIEELIIKREANPENGVAANGQKPQTTERAIIMADSNKPTPEELQAREQERVASIEKAGKNFSARIKGGIKRMEALVKDAVTLGVTFEEFRGKVYDSIDDTDPLDTTAATVDLTEKQLSEYSITRAIDAILNKSNCVEREISDTIAVRLKETGVGYKAEGILVPRAIRMMGMHGIPNALHRREMNTGTATAGGNLVATNLLAAEFAQYLRPKLLRDRIGVRYLPGVVGSFTIPRQTGASTFSIVAEATATATESALTIGSVSLAPKEASIWIEYSRRLLAQSTPPIDAMINEDLNLQTELGWENQLFHGAGTLAPTGIEHTTGVGSIVDNGADIGRAGIVDFKTQLRAANAEIGGINAVANPITIGLLQSRPEQASWPKYLIGDDDTMMGQKVENTTNVDEGYIFYGVFNTVLMADWDVYDLIVNPYTKDKEGIIRVSLRSMRDVGVKQPSALVMASGIS